MKNEKVLEIVKRIRSEKSGRVSYEELADALECEESEVDEFLKSICVKH